MSCIADGKLFNVDLTNDVVVMSISNFDIDDSSYEGNFNVVNF
jgi:hypothetical protein